MSCYDPAEHKRQAEIAVLKREIERLREDLAMAKANNLWGHAEAYAKELDSYHYRLMALEKAI